MNPEIRKWLARALMLGLALLLLAWAFRDISLADIGTVLARLTLRQIGLVLLVNIAIILLLGLRWWLILRAQNYSLSYIATTLYRLAAFGVSYFTPGPHFGGEPLQVYFVRKHHGVPGSSAVAAITLDKMIELFSNFAFLSIALGAVFSSGVVLQMDMGAGQCLFVALSLLPPIYLLTLWVGLRPVSWLSRPLPQGWMEFVQPIEQQLGRLTRGRPGILIQTLGASLIVWAALLFEYGLMLRFLGLSFPLNQLLTIVVAARLAMLAPTPGALGALEAGQVLAMQALELDPALGLSLSLLIRARDMLFGTLGLWLGTKLVDP